MKTRRIKLKEKYSRKHKGGGDPPPPGAPPGAPIAPIAPITGPPTGPPPGPTTGPIVGAPPGPTEPPPPEEGATQDFIKDIRSKIIAQITNYTTAEKETFKQRIIAAVSNAKNGISSNTTRKQYTNTNPDSSELKSTKDNFNHSKNILLDSLDRQIIGGIQKKFIDKGLDYYYSRSKSLFSSPKSLFSPKLEKGDFFSQTQYDELVNKAYNSEDPNMKNPEFKTIFTKLLADIESKYFKGIIKTFKKGMLYGETSIVESKKFKQNESTLSEKIKEQTELLKEVNSAITMEGELAPLLRTIITTTPAGSPRPVAYDDQAATDAAVAAAAAATAAARPPKPIDAVRRAAATKAHSDAYVAYKTKLDSLNEIKKVILEKTRGPLSKDYYDAANDLGLAAGIDKEDYVQFVDDNGDQIDDVAILTVLLIKQFKPILEKTIKTTKASFANESGVRKP